MYIYIYIIQQKQAVTAIFNMVSVFDGSVHLSGLFRYGVSPNANSVLCHDPHERRSKPSSCGVHVHQGPSHVRHSDITSMQQIVV